LLFDSSASGSGLRADWPCAAELARRSELVLAGGLDAANVGEAIASVRPFGVDASSGVERSPGVKDRALIRNFIQAARRASEESRA
jgi:phosphoribosylanthranilate isomerase